MILLVFTFIIIYIEHAGEQFEKYFNGHSVKANVLHKFWG